MSDFSLKRDLGAWHVGHGFYGECESVEAVFYPKRENYYLGVGINLTYEGCYQLRISDMKQLDRRKHRLILLKSYCHNVVLKTIYLDFDALNINPKGPIKLKLTFTNFAGEQLIKLMTLGLTEREAEAEIINGFLR